MNPNNFSQHGPGGSGINPAMLAAFQQQQKTPTNFSNINPQLLNGSYPQSGGAGSTISPSQLMQQQQMSMMGGGINPAALSASQQQQQLQQQLQQQQQQQQQQQMFALLNSLGMSREQFTSLSPQDRQLAFAKYFSANQQQQQHQQQQQQQLQMERERQAMGMGMSHMSGFERPSSSASSHSQMMPPPPRPPTAQGGGMTPLQQQQMQQAQQQMQQQHSSRPGTSLAHRSPTIGGPPTGSMQDMMQAQRPQSRIGQRSDNTMNGFKPSQQQQQHNQQSMFTNSQGPHARPPSSQGNASSNANPNLNSNAPSNSNLPPSSTSPPAILNSPYHGTKRKLAGDMPGGGGGGMSGMGNMGMGMGMGGMGGSSMNPMVGQMSNSMSNPMANAMSNSMSNPMPNAMSNSLPNSMSNPMISNSLANLGGMGMQGMSNLSNMAGLSQLGGGMPGSPRIGGGMGLGGAMGPPGLPRSISGDGMGGGIGNIGNMGGIGSMSGGMGGMGGMGGGGMGGGMGSMMTNMAGLPNTMNMGGLGMGGGGGGVSGNMGALGGLPNMGNLGSTSNMGMSPGMMNGQRGSPRPQSSMGMAGLPGSMGGIGGMSLGMSGAGGGGMGMGGMGSGAGLGGSLGMSPGSSGGGMGGMNMNIDIPSRGPHGMQGAGGLPQTPLRQGSLPPQATATPPHVQLGGAHGHAPSTPLRQGSLPPGGGMGTPGVGGMSRGGMGMGMSGMGPMGGMSLGGNAPSSPHPSSAGLGIGAPPLGPSLSASSLSSMGGGPGSAPMTVSTAAASSAAQGPGGALAPPSAVPSVPSVSGDANVNGLAGSGSAATGGAPVPAPPAPPSGANYNPKTTEVTVVPLVSSLSTIPPLSPTEVAQVQEWMATDRAYEARLREMQGRMLDEAREAFSVGGPAGLQWWQRGAPGNGVGNWNRWRRQRELFDVRYPRPRREGPTRSGRKGARREGLKLPRAIELADAIKPETLVPIRIEFDVEHHKMRDTFVWNLNDPIVTPEIFAQSVVEDYNLAPSYHSVIVKSIQDQLSDFRAHSANYDGDGAELGGRGSAIKGELEEEDAKWWEVWRRRMKLQSARALAEARGLLDDDDDEDDEDVKRPRSSSYKRRKLIKTEDLDDDADGDVSMLADNEDEQDPDDDDDDVGDKNAAFNFEDDEFSPLGVDEFKLDEKAMHEDMRIVIKLDIIVGSIKLDDQFEWDLDNPTALPEEFAEVYTQELGLGGEFKTAISHSIREQVQTYQKSLFLVGHPSDGTAVQDDDLKQSFLPSLTSGARPVSDVGMFTPLLNYLSDGDLERTEKERDKDLNKRRKRNTRGRRGIALPDREPIRTYRTPAIGFPELDAATLALAAAASAPMSRRAAAAAASLTIANMVASENGITFTPQQMLPSAPQPPPTAATSKDKKPKGLFKPPVYPPTVLRPRAHVVAPTPSTAADASMSSVPADNEAPRSSSSVAPSQHDNRSNKIITAKRMKELEREAKEKEFVDGQHPNYIDGVWHCSNCGCPESIAVGRRKGPLGNKSQCGTCGKFWHRHRRPRPVEYNANPAFHSGIKQKENDAGKMPASKKKTAAAALRMQSAGGASEPQTPSRSNGDIDGSRRSASPHGNDDDRGISPISTASSASEPPLAQRVKLNGSSHAKSTPTPAPQAATPAKPQVVEPPTSSTAPAASASAPPSPTKTRPPLWLSTAIQNMQARYPNDKFEVILRKVNASSTPEWRIKCLDCPGKLYTPGPGETLSNYDVHLKNRQHRQRVNERLSGQTVAAGGPEIPSAAGTTSTAAAPPAAAASAPP